MGGDDDQNLDAKDKSSPGFFQPNFVQKSTSNLEEITTKNDETQDKSQSGFGDVPLKEWFMHGNF